MNRAVRRLQRRLGPVLNLKALVFHSEDGGIKERKRAQKQGELPRRGTMNRHRDENVESSCALKKIDKGTPSYSRPGESDTPTRTEERRKRPLCFVAKKKQFLEVWKT